MNTVPDTRTLLYLRVITIIVKRVAFLGIQFADFTRNIPVSSVSGLCVGGRRVSTPASGRCARPGTCTVISVHTKII